MSLPEPVIPTFWPKFVTAGTTFKLDRSFSDYGGAPNWLLSVLFAGPHTASFAAPPQITPDPTGSTFHIVLGPADTQTLNPGGGASLAYTVVERLTGTDGEVFDVSVEKIMVSPNIALAAAGDYLTAEEKILAQLQTALAARIAGGAVESYSIAGRSITKVSTKELRDMIGSYKWIVYRQRNPGRPGIPGTFSFPVANTNSPYPDFPKFRRGDW
jgi:hypothetical protein